MKNFWPSFFAFLIVVALMVGMFRPDLVEAGLIGTGIFLVYLGWVLLSAFVVAAILAAVLMWRKQSLNANRPVDGAYPLQRFRLQGGRTLLVNPSMMIGPAAVIDRVFGYQEQEHAAGWENVVKVRDAYERSNTVRAMFPGDAARRDKWGAMSPMPRVNAATLKAIEAKPSQRPMQPAPVDVQPVRPIAPVSLHDGMQSNDGARLAIGQDIATGDIVHVDFSRSVHVRFHGATQDSGKTNACKTLLVGALRAGWHVVICDRRRFKDFNAFAERAELIATNDPSAFVQVLQRLVAIYQHRDRKLADQRATNVGEGRGMQRILVMVSEFGALCVAAKGDGVYSDMAQPLKLIMREAGAAGIHMLFEEQVIEPNTWPGSVVGNSAAYVGRMPSRAGQTVGYYHSDKLPSYHFYHDGITIKTWDMSKDTPRLLASVPCAKRSIMTVREGVRSGVGGVSTRDEHPTNTQRTPPTNTPNEQGRWHEFVMAYMNEHQALYSDPPQGIRALARAMSTADTGDDKAAARYVGIASETATRIREARRQSPVNVRREPPTAAEQLANMGIDWEQVTVKGRKYND